MEYSHEIKLLPEGYSYHSEGYIWYVLDAKKFSALPEKVNVEGVEFKRKSEFHVTIINARLAAEEDLKEEKLQTLLSEYVKVHPISFARFYDDLRLAVLGDRKSIAVRCEMQGLDGYFKRIEESFGVIVPIQPPHVSIYTETGMAVGINSDAQMKTFQRIYLPEIQAVLDTITDL